MKSSFICSLLIVLTTTTYAASGFKPKATYGEDNRQEMYASTADWQEISKAIAGKVSFEHITDHKGYWQLEGLPLSRRVCPAVRFAEQVTVPNCSGFLVRPNILVTAGHCMAKAEDCSQNYWVFGFALQSQTDLNYQKVSPDQVYNCKKVIARRQEAFSAVDYTIIELDRPVVNRTPLVLGFHLPVAIGQTVTMIGHPSGLPMKITDSASILGVTNLDRTIETDLDLFHGNSGSPVFDTNSKEVIGIMSNGHSDYIRDEEKLCKVPKICKPEDKCYLSAASRVTNMLVEPIFNEQK
jgi:V8-like Glu-specific endopeptidase